MAMNYKLACHEIVGVFVDDILFEEVKGHVQHGNLHLKKTVLADKSLREH